MSKFRSWLFFKKSTNYRPATLTCLPRKYWNLRPVNQKSSSPTERKPGKWWKTWQQNQRHLLHIESTLIGAGSSFCWNWCIWTPGKGNEIYSTLSSRADFGQFSVNIGRSFTSPFFTVLGMFRHSNDFKLYFPFGTHIIFYHIGSTQAFWEYGAMSSSKSAYKVGRQFGLMV